MGAHIAQVELAAKRWAARCRTAVSIGSRVLWIGLAAASLIVMLVAAPLHARSLLREAPHIQPLTGQLGHRDIQALHDLGLNLPIYALFVTGMSLFISLCMSVLAVIIFVQRNTHVGAWLLSLGLSQFGIISSALPASLLEEPGSVFQAAVPFLRATGLCTLYVAMLGFPNGRIGPKWVRLLALGWTSYVLATLIHPKIGTAPSVIIESFEQAAGFAWQLFWLVLLVIAQIQRFRVAQAEERAQTRWAILGWSVLVSVIVALVAPLALTSYWSEQATLSLAARLLAACLIFAGCFFVCTCYAVAILRFQLFGISLIISRALVYGLATLVSLTLYLVIVIVTGAILQMRVNPTLAIIATALVAVLFRPIHTRIQHAVNHFLYGRRDDPYKILSQLGQLLELSAGPEALKHAIVSTITQALRLPFVRIEIDSNSVADGTDEVAVTRIPLIHQGQSIGVLLVRPRRGEHALSNIDRRVLLDLARPVAAAMHALNVTQSLREAREQLVLTREEERRRIRNDLHDGLAPTLSSLQLQLAALRQFIHDEPSRADEITREMSDDLRNATGEIRRLVYNLRPAALDDLGLVDAVRLRMQRMQGRGRLEAELRADALPELPAAVEVAALRVIDEALTNVARHSGASHCVVSLRAFEGQLQVTVGDNGHGLLPGANRGIGLTSMYERVVELGGSYDLVTSPAGTEIRVILPLRAVKENPEWIP